MKCPVCKDVTLIMAERNGVEIDYCPECRGVWLDRGELDKIIERAHRGEFSGTGRGGRDARDGRFHEAEERARYERSKKKKKESPLSTLGDILEIFGGE